MPDHFPNADQPLSSRPNPAPKPATKSATGWQAQRKAAARGRGHLTKNRPWLRLLNDADQVEGFEYHNPRLSIFYPQEGL